MQDPSARSLVSLSPSIGMTRLVLFSEILRRSAQGDREGDPSARAGCALLDGDDSETLQNKFLTVALKQERKASPRACLLFDSVAALSVPSQSSTWLLRLFRASQVHGCFVCSEPVKYMAALSVPSRLSTWLLRLFFAVQTRGIDRCGTKQESRFIMLSYCRRGSAAIKSKTRCRRARKPER